MRHLPADAALWRSVNPERATWTLERHLLAGAVDALRVANWQRAGSKRNKRPKPLPRPGIGEPSRIGDPSQLDPAEIRALLDARKPRPAEEVSR